MDRVAELIAKLRDTDEDVRWNAAMALAEIAHPLVIPSLVDALQDPDRSVRRAAAKALGEIKDPQAVPALIAALQDTDVRGATVRALGKFQDPRAISALIGVLQNKDTRMAWNASVALRRFGSSAVPALIEGLKYGEDDLRQNAAEMLGEIGDSDAVSALAEVFRHEVDKNYSFITPNWELLRIIVEAIGKHGNLALSRLSSDMVPALIEALPSGNVEARRNVVELLGRIGDSKAVAALVEILGSVGHKIDASQKVPWNLLVSTAKALSQIAKSDPTPVLRSALPSLRRLQKRDPAFQEALNRIEAATVGMKDLPLAAAAPLPDARNLPRPAVAPSMSPDGLPIPASAENEDKDAVIAKRPRWFWREKRH